MVRVIKSDDLHEICNIESKNFINSWGTSQFKVYLNKIDTFNIVYDKKNTIYGYIFGEIIDGSYHLYKISVIDKLMNQGIGSLLLNYLIKYLKELNLLYIYLEVRASNIIAIKLYEKYGFENINIRKKYYNKNEDALLYNLLLK